MIYKQILKSAIIHPSTFYGNLILHLFNWSIDNKRFGSRLLNYKIRCQNSARWHFQNCSSRIDLLKVVSLASVTCWIAPLSILDDFDFFTSILCSYDTKDSSFFFFFFFPVLKWAEIKDGASLASAFAHTFCALRMFRETYSIRTVSPNYWVQKHCAVMTMQEKRS